MQWRAEIRGRQSLIIVPFVDTHGGHAHYTLFVRDGDSHYTSSIHSSFSAAKRAARQWVGHDHPPLKWKLEPRKV